MEKSVINHHVGLFEHGPVCATLDANQSENGEIPPSFREARGYIYITVQRLGEIYTGV